MQNDNEIHESGETTVTLNPTEEAATLNSLAHDINAWAEEKGFNEDYDDADWLEDLVRNLNLNGDAGARLVQVADRHREMATTKNLMLMVSELSEALEAQRDGESDPEHTVAVELADTMIRILHLAGTLRLPIGDLLIKKMDKNAKRPRKHGRRF